MSVFDGEDPYGLTYFREIEKTQANCVRIVWQMKYSNGTPTRLSQLDTLIRNCIARKMIPMVEMHDATCNLAALPSVTSYWARPDVAGLVKKYEHALLVNIANEAGDDQVTGSQFTQAYQDAITNLRNAGIRTPLVIDAPGCGRNLEILVAAGAALTAHDPQHNLLFSVHPYWSKLDISQHASPTFIRDQLQAAVAGNLPLILGELCAYGGWPGSNNEIESCGPNGSIDYQTLLAECARHNIGWLAWEWGPGNGFYRPNQAPIPCKQMDITTDGTYGSIVAIQPGDPNAWAKEVVVSSPYGIVASAKKTPYVSNGFRCP